MLSLRVTDQETARVVAVHRNNYEIVGAGCLVNHKHILTCRHVVEAATAPASAKVGMTIIVTLVGVTDQPTEEARVLKLGGERPENDLALLELVDAPQMDIPPVEFASPLRHSGKAYSVLGFPSGNQQGRNVTGLLHAADAKGLVQMDRGGALSVLGGFSGAPVWSSHMNAFVGLVVTELANAGVSWCIPSRNICAFYPKLRVRFRIPPVDRPVIHDYWEDDPNVDLFGTVSDNGHRRLTATVKSKKRYYDVTVSYECLDSSPNNPRGHYVTFITYPDFKREREDAYELFAEIKKHINGLGWYARQKFRPKYLFTVAAIGDGGDTALTLRLERGTKPKSTQKADTSRRGKKRRGG